MGTEDYYKAFNSKDEKFHEKLKELIIKLKKRGAKIILSYRATVTSAYCGIQRPILRSKTAAMRS